MGMNLGRLHPATARTFGSRRLGLAGALVPDFDPAGAVPSIR